MKYVLIFALFWAGQPARVNLEIPLVYGSKEACDKAGEDMREQFDTNIGGVYVSPVFTFSCMEQ